MNERRLCVCSHDITEHKDYDGNIHECTATDCHCPQFLDDEPPSDAAGQSKS